MSLEVALTAVDWLLEASLDARDVNVNLIGGEPLLAWPTISRLVPYAKRRASAFGKAIQFGTTTNLTRVTDDIVAFADQWGMGWHCSIDGAPPTQNANRPAARGRSSAAAAARGARRILKVRPAAAARVTVMPEDACRLYENLRYLEQLGFTRFAFAIASPNEWRAPHFTHWAQQWTRIAHHVISRYRAGTPIDVEAFSHFISRTLAAEDTQYSCGAGRGMMLIDHAGDIWPCHRWDGADLETGAGGQWRLGNIFRSGFNDELHLALLERNRAATRKPACRECPLDPLCAGGCPASNLSTTRSVYRQDGATCNTLRVLHRQALRIHDTLVSERNSVFLSEFYPPRSDQPGAPDTHVTHTSRAAND